MFVPQGGNYVLYDIYLTQLRRGHSQLLSSSRLCATMNVA